jgi:hypothetical protein
MFKSKPATPTHSSSRSAVFKKHLTTFESSLKLLETELKAHTHKHKSGSAGNKVFADKLASVAGLEEFGDLGDAFKKIGAAFEAVSAERLTLLGEGAGGDAIMARVGDVRKTVVEPTKALLADRDAKVKLVDSETKKYMALRTKAGKRAFDDVKKQETAAAAAGQDAPAQSAADAQTEATEGVEMPETLLDATDALANTDAAVDENSVAYEHQRVADMQLLMEDMIRRELQYHCRAVELLSPLIAQLRSVDGEKGGLALAEKLKCVELGERDHVLREGEMKKRGFSVTGNEKALKVLGDEGISVAGNEKALKVLGKDDILVKDEDSSNVGE